MSMIKEWLYQLLGHYYTWMAVRYRQIQTYSYSLFHPYHYDADRYGDSFLEEPCEFAYSNNLVKHIERVIYIFWTGDNEITPNRMEGIHSLEKVCGVKVQLITPKNLPDYIKQERHTSICLLFIGQTIYEPILCTIMVAAMQI